VRAGARLTTCLSAWLVALACLATGADASPPPPAELSVVGGDTWHAGNVFSITWAPPPAVVPPILRARYRIRDPQGAPLGEGSVPWDSYGAGALMVPPVPGTYSAEVRFEDAAGMLGPAASVPLRFDHARPGATAVGPVPAWIGRTALPLRVHLGHPAGPLPLSRIRGYAASVDPTPGGTPCSLSDICSEQETTLRGGVAGDVLTIPTLPEGASYLNVVAVSGAGVKSATPARAVLHVDTADPVTQLSGAPEGWTNRTVELTASAIDSGAGMVGAGSGPQPLTAIRIEDAAPTIAFGPTVTASVIDEGTHLVRYYARDAAGNTDDGGSANGVVNHPPRTAWVRIDRTAPTLAFANSQDPDDPDLIRARIADQLSGPNLTRGWIGVRRAGSGERFKPLPAAEPADGELRARWQSDEWPTGSYEFEAAGFDAAGNVATTTRRANGVAMVLTNPLKATTRLRCQLAHGRLTGVAPYGRSVRLRGQLTTGLSSGLAGATLRVIERFAAGATPPVRVSTVRTGPGGAISLRTAPGPSRTIELAFDGSRRLAPSSAKPLSLLVRGRVRLHASAGSARVGGRPVIFRGRVVAPAGAIPTKGLTVQLQFRFGRSPWAEFRTVQTDSRGRFRYPYRFSDDDSRGVSFQFRAYVPAHENWPYEPAGSRPVIVRGR